MSLKEEMGKLKKFIGEGFFEDSLPLIYDLFEKELYPIDKKLLEKDDPLSKELVEDKRRDIRNHVRNLHYIKDVIKQGASAYFNQYLESFEGQRPCLYIGFEAISELTSDPLEELVRQYSSYLNIPVQQYRGQKIIQDGFQVFFTPYNLEKGTPSAFIVSYQNQVLAFGESDNYHDLILVSDHFSMEKFFDENHKIVDTFDIAPFIETDYELKSNLLKFNLADDSQLRD